MASMPIKWEVEEQTKGMYGPVTRVRVASEWMAPEHAQALRHLMSLLPGAMAVVPEEPGGVSALVEDIGGCPWVKSDDGWWPYGVHGRTAPLSWTDLNEGIGPVTVVRQAPTPPVDPPV